VALRPSRRDFLKGGAAAGAGLASGLLSESLLDAMAQPQTCGKLTDIEHVVIFVQENRSFDHYFGTYPPVRGFADPGAILQPDGSSIFAALPLRNQPAYQGRGMHQRRQPQLE